MLDKLIAEAPFAIRGIQVDGGAEFKSAFELECQARGLELFVLPQKRPDLNGCVERAQSTWRYQFYATYDLPRRIDQLQAFVDAFAHKFNHYRPHDAPAGRTPAESSQNPRLRRPSSVSYVLNPDRHLLDFPVRDKLAARNDAS